MTQADQRPMEIEAEKSLKRIQDTDPNTLARTADMPQASNFSAVVDPARKLVELFSQIPVTVLAELPEAHLTAIRDRANAVFNSFEQVRNFNIETGNLSSTRNQIVQWLSNAYPDNWTYLHPLIGYAAARLVDFKKLEQDGRAAVQHVSDQTAVALDEINRITLQATEALDAARRAASEQGVSQQAVYFRDEANSHDKEAKIWQKRTFWFASGLGLYALLTLVVYKWTWLKPSDAFESAQLLASKILIFAVISYLLLLAARNFLSHRHNAIVNKHRQNALMTFNALVTAASEDTAKDIILTHAAACIFSPQETGYAKSGNQEGSLAQAMAGLLAKSETKAG